MRMEIASILISFSESSIPFSSAILASAISSIRY